MSIIN
jgi:Reverse transcriptase (RNA-dependent DNA polymerase)